MKRSMEKSMKNPKHVETTGGMAATDVSCSESGFNPAFSDDCCGGTCMVVASITARSEAKNKNTKEGAHA